MLSAGNIVILSCAVLSIAGSSIIMSSFVYFRKARNPSSLLIFFLALSDLGSSFPFFIATDADSAWCTIQAVSLTFWQLAGILWTVVIARFMYKVIVLSLDPQDASVFYKYFAIVNSVSLLAAVLPFTTDSYGSTGTWCWIKSPDHGLDTSTLDSASVWWRMITFYFPLWIAVGHNTYMYFRMVDKLQNLAVHSNAEDGILRVRLENLVKKLKWYPIILALCYFPSTVLRLYNFTDGGSAYWLEIVGASCGNLVGFFDCIVYGFGIVHLWKIEFNRLIGQCCCLSGDPGGSVGTDINNPLSTCQSGGMPMSNTPNPASLACSDIDSDYSGSQHHLDRSDSTALALYYVGERGGDDSSFNTISTV